MKNPDCPHRKALPLHLILLAFLGISLDVSARARVAPIRKLPGTAAPSKAAGAAAFTIDTTSNTKVLLDRVTKNALPPSVTVGAMTLFGEKTQSGRFQGFPVLAGNTLEDGIVLSTGNVNDINDEANTIVSPALDGMDLGGDPKAGFQRPEIIAIAKATAKVPPDEDEGDFSIYDPSSFKINFTTTAQTRSLSVDFIYGSEEYPVYLKSAYNDIFLIFLDGKNIAFDSDGRAISVGNNFFRVENTPTRIEGGEIVRDTEDENPYINKEIRISGFTPPLRAQSNIRAGSHTLEFVIVDISDPILNSSVFLSNLRFSADTVVPGLILKKDLIQDQAFSVLETLKPGEEVGFLSALVSKDSLTFSILPASQLISIDAKTGRLVVAPGASLAPYRGQDITLKVAVNTPSQADTAQVLIHVIPVEVPVLPVPVLLSVSQAVYLDATGNGHIDQALIEFPRNPGKTPARAQLQDPFSPAQTLEVAGAKIVRLDSSHFRLDFPEREFAYGTGFQTASLGKILQSDSIFSILSFLVEDGIGPLPNHADATGPQKLADKPTLAVLFSEGVKLDPDAKAFPYDVKRPGQDLAGKIKVESIRDLGGNVFLYTFSSPDYPLPGDSLQLQSGNPHIADARGTQALMNFFIPVTGKFPAPVLVLQGTSPGLVSSPALSTPMVLSGSILVEAESRPGFCLNCRDPQGTPALQEISAESRLRKAVPTSCRSRPPGLSAST